MSCKDRYDLGIQTVVLKSFHCAEMSTTQIQTRSLTLVLQTPEDVHSFIEGMDPEQRKELSPDWLALVDAATSPNPWIHGFVLRHRDTDIVIGRVGFKGPPTGDGVVEIAYGVDPNYQSKGYATEAAEALIAYALSREHVRVVRAHTRPEANASTRVLTKCGFRCVGEVMDPEDGRVWRWEKAEESTVV